MKTIFDFVSDIGLASLWDNTLVVSFKSAPFINHISLYIHPTGCTVCESDKQITCAHRFH